MAQRNPRRNEVECRGRVPSGGRSHPRVAPRPVLASFSKAVEIASREGLESLAIGRLAGQLRLSKSGLFAHFGSKQKLQLATIEWAKEAFSNDILIPAETVPAGLARLWSLCDLWRAPRSEVRVAFSADPDIPILKEAKA